MKYEELVVRRDEDGLGVVYLAPEFIGYRVLVVPLEEIDAPWVKEARGEK